MKRLRGLLTTRRCVTLTGLGGVGKTRLALEVAARHGGDFEGAWLAELAEVASPGEIANRVALSIFPRITPGEDPVELIAVAFGDRSHLLVLDGCERHVESCAQLADTLVGRCPRLTILATSRERLAIEGEVVVRARPLADDSAVELFIDRAQSVVPELQLAKDNRSISRICYLLEGLPLAIELAAPWAEVLSPEEMLPLLDDRLGLSSIQRDRPHRQQTLRTSIDWSYHLLTDDERALFRRLAVFAGGFTVKEVETICSGGAVAIPSVLRLLFALSRKSLLQRETVGKRTRYTVLETLSRYALERLREAGEEALYRERHLDHFLEQAQATFETRTREGLVPEANNLLAALRWAEGRDPEKALALAGTMARELTAVVGPAEGYRIVQRGLEQARPGTIAYIRGLNTAGMLATFQSDLEVADNLFHQAGGGAADLDFVEGVGVAEFGMGLLSVRREDNPGKARAHLGSALRAFDRGGLRVWYAETLIRLAEVQVLYARDSSADEAVERSVAMAGEVGATAIEALALEAAAMWALRQGDRTKSVSLFKRALTLGPPEERPIYLLLICGLAAGISRADPWKAMRLWGFALGHPALWGGLPAAYERLLGRPRKEAQRLIGADQAELAWKAGADLTSDQVLREALQVEPPASGSQRAPGDLTEREFEIVRLVAEGGTSREIAGRLHLSDRTVENHVQHALSKLGLHRRTQLAGWVHGLRDWQET